MSNRIAWLVQNGINPFDAVVDAFAHYVGPPADQWVWADSSHGTPPGVPVPPLTYPY